MDLSKFTERSRGFLQAAQTIAMRESHQKLAPEHLLKALMDDDQGLASNLIKRAGGQPQRVVEAVELALGKIPKVGGDAGQTYMDSQTAKVLGEAEKLAQKAKDSFVPVERILTALAVVKSPAKDALDQGGCRRRASTRRSTISARAAPPTRRAPRIPMRRWRNTRTTSRRRPKRARSTPLSAATMRSAARCRCSAAAPRTTRF
jgi:ATP-dependent Clp protease ATP-binding subunit ClpA